MVGAAAGASGSAETVVADLAWQACKPPGTFCIVCVCARARARARACACVRVRVHMRASEWFGGCGLEGEGVDLGVCASVCVRECLCICVRACVYPSMRMLLSHEQPECLTL